MVERKQVALIYDYDANWIGGTYYILNIIKALGFLPDEEKPQINLYHDHSDLLTDIIDINYPHINYIGFDYKPSRRLVTVNNIFLLLFGKELATVDLPGKSVHNFYYRKFYINTKNIDKYYCWIPDFQDLYLPHFFKKRELKLRFLHYKRMVDKQEPIVFSSQSAANDLGKFFPQNTNQKKVLRFVSTSNPNFKLLSIADLKVKFGIKGDYLITSNQFWRHKNHMVVLQAFEALTNEFPDIQLVLTGKEYDHRDPNYTQDLKEYVRVNNLDKKVLFLGFIDREEQLKLMSDSIAVIQPSLFEGWSTVVEDAKFLNKCIICSDIPVHREQLPDSTLFFNPHDAMALKKQIVAVLNKTIVFNINYDHQTAVIDFARNFLGIFYDKQA